MKKPLVIAAAIGVAVIAGWSGLWFAGRGAVADRIDREVAKLQARGFGIAYASREIGGFPFGYRVAHRGVTLREPAGGAIYRLPEIITEVTAADVDRLATRFPATFRVDLPLDEAGRARWPGMPEIVEIDVEAADLVATSDGSPGSGRQVNLAATSLLIVTGSAEQPLNLAIELTALDSKATLPAPSSGLPATGVTTLDRLDYAYTASTPDRRGATVEGSIDDLRLTGDSDIRDLTRLLALAASGTGASNLAFQTGSVQTAVRLDSRSENPDSTVGFSAGSSAGTLALAGGTVEFATASQANRMTLAAAAGPGTPAGKPFGAGARAIEMQISGPLAPSMEMGPVALRLAFDRVVPDAEIWQLIDASGDLPRDPARLVLDLAGSARITGELSAARPGEAPPVEFGNLSIRSADVSAFGAGLAARGDVEFLQPLNLPVGAITVTLSQAAELVVKLADAGVIDPVTAQTATLMAMSFTAPGPAPGELVSEIVMTLDGITVNGQPVGGN